jgi:DNA-binding response OmpR family regulator
MFGMIKTFGRKVRKKILIAEDDPTMRKLMELQLVRQGYDVTAVEDGRQALLLLQQEKFDLVISDIIMPFVSGLELLNSMRKAKNDIAIILCSSLKSENAVSKAFEIGANGFIPKPYSSQDMLSEVELILNRVEQGKAAI